MRTQAEIYDVVREALSGMPVSLLRDVADNGPGVAKLVGILRRAGLPKDRVDALRQFIINNARMEALSR